jgi:hypothetical protein
VPLFVVMTNLPGPGAHAALVEAGLSTQDDTAVRDALDKGACEFVELENEHGAGVGPSSGVTWQTESSFLSDKTLAKLGPFVADTKYCQAIEALREIAQYDGADWDVEGVCGHAADALKALEGS